ncbi:hypothetical protein I6E29_00160 [Arcanobacterium haemolyticum]|nr:hypothetical protein [Arcanobacterium haemolyticum]
MSAMPNVASTSQAGARPRPVIQGLPKLSLVPTPAPSKGIKGTVAACLALFFGAFGVVFFLNTQMVASAYEVQSVNREINATLAQKETLEDQVVNYSTTSGLAQRAQELGLVQATEIRYLDVATGVVLDPKQIQEQTGK